MLAKQEKPKMTVNLKLRFAEWPNYYVFNYWMSTT
jgi:hypothetical protein